MKGYHLIWATLLFASCAKEGTWVPFAQPANKVQPGEVTQIDLGSIKYNGNKVRFWLKLTPSEKDQIVIQDRPIDGDLIKACVGRKLTGMLSQAEVDCSTHSMTMFDNVLIECGSGTIVRPKQTASANGILWTAPPLPKGDIGTQYLDMGDWFKYCKKPYEFWK